MKISIITVCFNSAVTIAETFESIQRQDYHNIEYIVIDGASTDGTLSIIMQNQNLITKWISEPDKGIYDAMNKGIAMATGDIIGILNSDDVYANSSVISTVADAFIKEKPDCIYGDLLYVKNTNTSKVIRYWKAGKYSIKAFYYGWMLPHPTFFVTKETYKACGLFDTRFAVASDYEFMLRVLVKHKRKATYLPIILVHMRQGGESNKSVENRKKSFLENHESWKVNGLNPYFFTIWLKIGRKLTQYFAKP